MPPRSLVASATGQAASLVQSTGSTQVHTLLCVAGLFTVSWDRLANVQVGPYNVKLPVLLFACVVATSLLARQRPITSTARRAVNAAVGLLVVGYSVGVLVAVDRSVALAQSLTLVLGSLVPFWAVSRTLGLGAAPEKLLTAFVGGGVAASLFGLYQLAGFYIPLPDPLPYEGMGGGQGRIASFSYEPAYFGYFLILVLGAYAAREVVSGGRERSRWSLVIIIVALLLSNSRAVALTLPLVAVLLLFRARYLTVRRQLAGPVILLALAFLAFLMVNAAGRDFLVSRLGSIVDGSEPTSNALRINGYEAIFDLIEDHWLLGVGPGSLMSVGPAYGLALEPDDTPNSVVANNIWLQALSDGGALLTLAHLVLVLVVTGRLFTHRLPAARALTAGWLTVVLVGGMLTSYFYDIKVWSVLGLAAGLGAWASRADGPDRPPTTPVARPSPVSQENSSEP